MRQYLSHLNSSSNLWPGGIISIPLQLVAIDLLLLLITPDRVVSIWDWISQNPCVILTTLCISTRKTTIEENESHIKVALISADPPSGAAYTVSLEQVAGAYEQTGWLNSPPPFTTEAVGSNSLRLFTGSHFLFQRLQQYTIRIRGCRQPTDSTLGEICTDIVMKFQVVDVNNRIPQFIDSNSLAEIVIPEDVPTGTQVLKLFAVDSDTLPAFRTVSWV